MILRGRHYEQYVETERLKVADIKPETEFCASHFKRYSEPISLPLRITDGCSARFDGYCTIRISKVGYLSREFPMVYYIVLVWQTILMRLMYVWTAILSLAW